MIGRPAILLAALALFASCTAEEVPSPQRRAEDQSVQFYISERNYVSLDGKVMLGDYAGYRILIDTPEAQREYKGTFYPPTDRAAQPDEDKSATQSGSQSLQLMIWQKHRDGALPTLSASCCTPGVPANSLVGKALYWTDDLQVVEFKQPTDAGSYREIRSTSHARYREVTLLGLNSVTPTKDVRAVATSSDLAVSLEALRIFICDARQSYKVDAKYGDLPDLSPLAPEVREILTGRGACG